LINIHKVLTNDGKEFAERVDREADENIAKMTLEERRKNFYRTFTVAQKLMDGAGARQKNLEGKTYKDVETKNQFAGSHEKGKKIFGQIEGQQSTSSFQSSSPQQRTNFEIIQDVRQNPRSWRVDEIIMEFDNFGRTNQETVLIHQSARLSDYDQRTGKLNLANNPIYQASRFNSQEIAEIQQALNISQQPTQVQQPPYK
jgi:hypothetical protein